MATVRYTFRPDILSGETRVVLNQTGIVAREGNGPEHRLAWTDIDEVHLEPGSAGDKARWTLRLRGPGTNSIRIDNVNFRGVADFEHKTNEFLAVLDVIHTALAPRGKSVRFRLGVRRWIIVAWQIALFMLLAVAVFGAATAIVVEQYETLVGIAPMIAFAVLGLLMLKGKSGPRDYNPSDFIASRDTQSRKVEPESPDRRGKQQTSP